MLTPVRRRLATLAVLALVPALGGCGIPGFAGSEYQTDQVYQPSVGANETSGTVKVLNAAIVSSTDGEGTFVGSFVNQDRTETTTVEEITGEGVKVEISTPVSIKPESLVALADTGSVLVTGEDVTPGKYVRLTMVFSSGQETTVNTPVVAAAEEFEDITPAKPSGSPSASPSTSPSASPSEATGD